MAKRLTHRLIGLCCALVLVVLPVAASAQPLAQEAPAWQRFIQLDAERQYDPYNQWLGARRLLLTNLDCYSASGSFMTLDAGQALEVEAPIVDSNGQAWTPLFFGLGSRCYVRAELAQFLDRPAAIPDFVLPYTLSDETIDGPAEIRLRAGQHILLDSTNLGAISIGSVEPASLFSCGSGGCWAWTAGEGSLELSAQHDSNVQRTVHVVVTP